MADVQNTTHPPRVWLKPAALKQRSDGSWYTDRFPFPCVWMGFQMAAGVREPLPKEWTTENPDARPDSTPFRVLRFMVGRWLVHLGLRVMPAGRVRQELDDLFNDWGIRVAEIVDWVHRRRGA
jgi:hypothetical protein